MERIRSFISIDINDQFLLTKIVRVQESLSGLGAHIKFVEPENIHMTLKFLGEISIVLIEKVKEVLGQIDFEPFIMRIEGLGAFPNIRRPRVIWLGVSEGASRIVEIQRFLEDRLVRLGFRRERGEFIPHITIGRVRGGNYERLRKRIVELRDLTIGDFLVNSVRLKKSTLTSKGPIYETLYEKHASR